jgi:tetratricopeptide (TPR) repeat protein
VTARQRLRQLISEAEDLSDRFASTGRAEDLDAAVSAWTAILRLEDLPTRTRLAALNNLAIALSDRYDLRGDSEDLDGAISMLGETLRAVSSLHSLRGSTLNNYAGRLSQRYERNGDPKDLEGAIATIREAVDLAADRTTRAQRIYNLAGRLSDRFDAFGDPRDLDAAIAGWREALSLTPIGAPQRSARLDSLAVGLTDSYERKGIVSDLDEALELWKEAIAVEPLPRYLSNRSSALWDSYERTGDLSVLDLALEDLKSALDQTPPRSPERPGRLVNRANWLSRRYGRTGDFTNLEAALADLDEAVSRSPDGDPHLATFLASRARVRAERFEQTRDRADLDGAVADAEQALHLSIPGSPQRPGHLHNLSNVLFARYSLGGDVGDLSAALDAIREAIAITAPGDPHHPGRLNALVNLLAARYRANGSPADLDEALSAARVDLAALPSSSPDRAGYLGHYASLLSESYQLSGDLATHDAAVEAFREACARGIETLPEVTVSAARAWLSWAIAREAWTEAAEAGELGLDGTDALVRVQAIRGAKESRLRDSQGMAARTAFAWAMLGDGRRAVLAAERGRAALFAETVELTRALDGLAKVGRTDLARDYEWAALVMSDPTARSLDDQEGSLERSGRAGSPGQELQSAIDSIRHISGFEAFLQRPTDEQVLKEVGGFAASQGAIVYIAAIEAGGIALIVPPAGRIRILGLPNLTERSLATKARAYSQTAAAFAADQGLLPAWLHVLDETTSWLWEAVWKDLLPGLAGAGDERVTIVPIGQLGLMPVHAAWTRDDSRPSGRRYPIDLLRISYAPNARALRSDAGPFELPTQSFLAIDEPWPSFLSAIKGSSHVVDKAMGYFAGSSTVLRHHAATSPKVLAAIPGKSVVHLSCHAEARVDEPLESKLFMAFGQPITLRELLVRRLDLARLVVLAACETALAGSDLPDEVISLATGLLQAGALAVVGSLWSVEDLATMVLLTRFYELWAGERLSIAEALRRAQLWTRDLTRKDRVAAFPGVDFTGSGQETERPYSNPFWWAAFSLTGCDS